ncbi:hypothetical protein EVAR_23796_1 [Eumeta japonica]|uniref:Uncharacterized protein n=1 Tax=Eumeta variegata TaxID=151549 RepID=A0A4C1VNU8_EUMVA|nr:hypothetical protein EVAR_23796_1 [Eumeta japonica]
MAADNEEWNNFMHRVNELSGLVRDMTSGDRAREERAKGLADAYSAGRDVVLGEGGASATKVKWDRTVINRAAFDSRADGEVCVSTAFYGT